MNTGQRYLGLDSRYFIEVGTCSFHVCKVNKRM